ncbi:MAG: DNA repair protein RecO [Bacteroidota bacterium]|nr:DNA repair protein RecO [Bacteroidota bacterium]
MSIYSTRGIVLRTVKYGETSVIATVFTELFGLQSYLVNGVRTQGKGSRAHFFQPGSLLELQVYHQELKHLQRIREMRWAVLYQHIFSDITRNAVTLFMVELLTRTLKQPEKNEVLFEFCQSAFCWVDQAEKKLTANFPIFFSLQLLHHLGFRIQDNYSPDRPLFNPMEGNFTREGQKDSTLISPEVSAGISRFLKIRDLEGLGAVLLNQVQRREILQEIEKYYMIHMPDFTRMKTLPVLHEILS